MELMPKPKKPYQDLTGQRFGRLTVLSLVDSIAGADVPTKWLCQCDCGNMLEVRAYNLKSGGSQSCGCLQRERAANRARTHGQTGSRLYVVWQHIIGRCNRKNDKAFKWYGGRGIRICDEWLDFQVFHDWAVSNGYNDDLTIDRIDVNGNYCPENCRWISIEDQQRNKTNNVFVEHDGQVKTVGEWAEIFGCFSAGVYREILLREGRVRGCKLDI